MAQVKVELLFLADCPNYVETKAILEDVLESQGLPTSIEMVRVKTQEDAARLHFLGSPTVRLNGKDIEDSAEGSAKYGLFFRKYKSPNPRGMVTKAIMLKAVKQHAGTAAQETRG